MESESPKSVWADQLPGGPPLLDELARLVDSDDARDEAENSYYEGRQRPSVREHRDRAETVQEPTPPETAAPRLQRAAAVIGVGESSCHAAQGALV
ncbi:hypothetical protein GCM10027053_46550 [Intrasporangium mesophilum]